MSGFLARLDEVLDDSRLLPVADRARTLDALWAERPLAAGGDDDGWLLAFGLACLAVLRRGRLKRRRRRRGCGSSRNMAMSLRKRPTASSRSAATG